MTRLPKDMPVPLEAEEQKVVVEYLEARGLKFTAIPNSTYTESKAAAGKNIEQGLRAGLPDLVVCLPGIGMLYIEMKRVRGGVVSAMQQEWIDAINTCPGSEAVVCYGADDAIRTIDRYLAIRTHTRKEPLPAQSPAAPGTTSNRGE